MYKKFIIGLLSIGIVVGLGLLLVNKNNQNGEKGDSDIVAEKPDGNAEFSKNVSLKLHEKITFADGLNVTLKEINDSRCAKGVVCIWQGEISSLIDVSGGRIATPAELRLGTENFRTQHMNGYTFALQDATPSGITLVVTYTKPPTTSGGCFVGGCSGQLCSDEQDVMSTCEYREEYACYQSARCERQSSGKCGWTQTDSLKLCLSKE